MVKMKTVLIRSLILAIIVFIGGIFLGTSLDGFRVNDLDNELKNNEINTESYFVEQQFIETFGGDWCELAETRIDALSDELADIGQILVKYEEKDVFKKNDYDYLSQKYFITEIKVYSLLKLLREDCAYNGMDIILFFYDKDQRESLQQGYALDSLVRQRENVNIFSIDRNFDDPLVETVKKHFKVEKSPTMIINFEKKTEEYVNVPGLFELLEK